MSENPNLAETLEELSAGIFIQQAQEALKQVALGVISTEKKKGSITITLELEKIGDTSSVSVNHTLKYTKPTRAGKASEESTRSTPMYVNNFGYLTIHPQTQEDIFAGEKKTNNVTTLDRKHG